VPAGLHHFFMDPSYRVLMKIARTLLFLLMSTAAFAQAPGEERAVAWVEAFNSGKAETMESFAQANYTPEMLARRDAAQRRATFEQISGNHGKLRVAAVDAALRLEVVPERGERLTLRFAIEPAAPHRIASLGIDIGGGRERAEKLPPLKLSGDLAAPLDSYVRQLPDFAGTVLVAKNGEVVFEKAYGLASRRWDVPNKNTTRFNVGSITKDFTKVAIGQLAQAGKLALDAPILTYLPNYPNKDAAQKITVQQLVDHTSGLGDVFTPRFFERNVAGFSTPQNFIDFFAADPLKFEPGKGQAYSNYGYTVLGEIIEAVSGEPYFDYIQKHVFDPAGMSGSGFFDLRKPVPDVAMGHTHRDGEWLENTMARPSLRGIPAGGSYSSARDLLAFDRKLRAGKLLDTKWTRWWFGGDPLTSANVWAGGSPGVNAGVASDGTWTVVVLTNVDPPTGELLAEKVFAEVSR
jgi:CubicO group peptidase (beta-lactamase class C family)